MQRILGGQPDRVRVADRESEVVGDRTGAGPAADQHLTGPSMQQPPAGGSQALVEHLADEGMREPHLGAFEYSESRVNRLADRVQDRVDRQLPDLRKHRDIHVVAEHRRHRQAVVRLLPQPGEAAADDLVDASRRAETMPTLGRVQPCQLLDEKRVAVGALVYRVGDLRIRPTKHLPHQRRGVRAVETLHGEPPEHRRERLQRNRSVRGEIHRVVAAGQQQQASQLGQHPGEELKQRKRSGVGQVDVFEDEQCRPARRSLGEAVGNIGEDRSPRDRRRVWEWCRGIEGLQRLPPRPIGHRFDLRAAPPADGAADRLRGQRLGQRGLADPRVAEQQQTSASAGLRSAKQVHEGAQLPAPPDQRLGHTQIIERGALRRT